MFRQTWASVLSWLLTVEFAYFPGVNDPSCSASGYQQLAPRMSQYVAIESCKPIQASFNKLQEGPVNILNLPSFGVAARP